MLNILIDHDRYNNATNQLLYSDLSNVCNVDRADLMNLGTRALYFSILEFLHFVS